MKRKTLLQRYGLNRRRDRQVVITAEKVETFVIRQQPVGGGREWCSQCGEEIECLTIDQTVMLTGLSARQVFRLVQADGLHFSETTAGQLLICPNSVAPLVRLDRHELASVG